MAATIPPTKLKIASAPEISPARDLKPLSIDLPKPGLDLGLGRAWLQRMLWGPVAEATEVLVSGSRARTEGQVFRVLVVGRQTAALRGMLAQSAARRIQFEVRTIEPDGEPSLHFESGAFDCTVALDWLPTIRPSQRESAVAELCRISRLGILIASPFYSPEVAAAERAVNTLYLDAMGEEHPKLGRHLEYGLPELERARAWVSTAFPHVTTKRIESLETWQVFASVAVDDLDDDISAEDATVAALLPPMVCDVQPPAYRTLITGSASPLAPITEPRSQGGDFGAMATHLAIEAAAQRRAFDRLTAAITNERDRERDQFQATVASLADEVREREAHTEMLAANLNELGLVVANQTAVIESLERRLNESDLRLHNVECERDAAKVEAEESVQLLSNQLLDAEVQLRKVTDSTGWKLLSRYGRLKYRYLLPVYRFFGRTQPK
jgi:hypothetical protein